MAKHATKAEQEMRIQKAANMLSVGSSRAQICQYLLTKHGCGVSASDRIMRRARKLMHEQYKPEELREATESHLHALRMVLQAEINVKDFRGARLTLDSIARLLSLEGHPDASNTGRSAAEEYLIVQKGKAPK